MGIYGALSTAVTGLRAQSHALENISGNIANSQTIGYKRIDTGFKDLIADAPVRAQIPGAVLAQSQSTNNQQGDIQTSANETYIALNGNGFFVVEPKIGQSDGNPVFAGTSYFTRRGDFEIDKDGLLVNGAGYYLKGLPIDTATGNISGSVPDVIKISNAYLPANVTRLINYQANLPQSPKTANYNAATPNSDLMKSWSYSTVQGGAYYPQTTTGVALPPNTTMTVPARATGSSLVGTAQANTVVGNGDILSLNIHGVPINLRFNTTGSTSSTVAFQSATAGAAATSGSSTIEVADIGNLVSGGGFSIGGTTVPLGGVTDGPTLETAVETAFPGSTATYAGTTLTVTYGAGAHIADTAVTGTGVTLTGATDGFAATSGTTTINIAQSNLAAIQNVGSFSINGTNVPFGNTFGLDQAGLQDAIDNVFPGASVAYNATTGELVVSYAPGQRVADTSAGSSEVLVNATGTIAQMMSSIQTALRAQTGDNTVLAHLRNGTVEISSGTNNVSALTVEGFRNSALPGEILGLASATTTYTANGAITAANLPAYMMVANGDTLTIRVGSTTREYLFDVDGTQTAGTGQVKINAGQEMDDMLAAIQADLRLHGGPGAADAHVSYSGGQVVVSMDGNYLYNTEITGTAAPKLGIGGNFQAVTGTVATITADDSAQFIAESISGGAITVYASNGAPANVQLRWAKVDSAATGGQDTWQLFYLSDSKATGGATAWTNVGQDYVFNANGSLVAPGVTEATISNLTVNGVAIGDVKLRHQENGVSQFADVNGSVSVSTLNQNGYGAGEFLSVAVTDAGRVVATYSNGERLELAQVATAQFNGVNSLKRLDGGVYQATAESGEPIIDLSGTGIIGGALEASNTDISDEFTKLIITQQAYSASTRIVSTADEMLQEVLNMIR